MSTSVGVNVLRWGALATGVFYGLYNQVSISSRERLQAKQREWEHHESLIQQAKAEWAKTHPSEQPKASSSSSAAKVDPKDPNADLNALLGITDEK
ncbi:F1F0 ATP synthase subunit e, mitochondrial [Didymosphaeria variabile]|uniref:ATP synthase F(0) complex subunit e, mitochondrial n=2 Tax=Didymosphaeriaceae TaxID=221678 RepID=A0A9W9C4T9_9PLEO|nr:F1F0 ATP synthase subunit e, mitochondrial [Didymosphaeria variabile]KAJ4345376.1 F1F0 ATP synthase subunit e, mitochondrial [Didymosphaeria variabile]